MEKSQDLKVVGQLPEKEFELFKSNLSQIGHLKYRIGDLETVKAGMLKELEDIQYSMKVMEQKVIKRYGPDSAIDTKTGEIKGKLSHSSGIKKMFGM